MTCTSRDGAGFWATRVSHPAGIFPLRREGTRRSAGMVADLPLRRAIDPQEIANLSLFLASDEASAITGQNVNVTAGAEMR